MGNIFHRLSKVAEAFALQRLVDEAADLKERVDDGRFYVACVGEFKRGKSTLLNALCNAPLLPTGILPVTAVPTIIRFGQELVVRVRLSAGDWQQIAPEQLTAYVSESQNPGNHKHVQAVEVFCPAPLLSSGLCLVDTPGIGSIFDSNTMATQAFVPQIDAALLLIGVDPPITGDELALAVSVATSARELILVLTKADRFTTAERTLREHRHDKWADLSPVLVSYSKAIEVQVNLILRAAMRSAPNAATRVKIGDATQLLPDALPLTAGTLAYVLGGEKDLGDHLRATLHDSAWFTGAFAVFLDQFAKARNESAHGESIARETVIHWRDRLLGVGCESMMGKLALVRMRSSH